MRGGGGRGRREDGDEHQGDGGGGDEQEGGGAEDKEVRVIVHRPLVLPAEEEEDDDEDLNDVVEVEADAEEALVPILNLAPYLQTVVTCEWVKVQKKSSTCADPEGCARLEYFFSNTHNLETESSQLQGLYIQNTSCST